MQQYSSSSSNINYNPISNNNNNNNNNISFPENDDDIIVNNNSFSKLDDYECDPAAANNFFHFNTNNFPNSPQMLESYESVYLQFYDLFHQQPQNTLNHENAGAEAAVGDDELKEEEKLANNNSSINIASGRKSSRCSKKDRHSKIITASGPRDRRMRLSLDVARRFFQLQDMLGYDKASRTVDWLLNMSRDAIEELMIIERDGRAARSTSSTVTTHDHHLDQVVSSTEKKKIRMTKKKKKKKKLVGGVNIIRGSVGKESRQKARERARERTSQKKRLHNYLNEQGNNNNNNNNNNNSTTAAGGPWNINTSTTTSAALFDYQEEEGRRYLEFITHPPIIIPSLAHRSTSQSFSFQASNELGAGRET